MRFASGLLLCVVLAGCTRTAPLDEPVRAATFAEFMHWQEKNVIPFGEPIVSEFQQALITIAHNTAGYRAPVTVADHNSPYNALCKRLAGHTLRDVIVEGYEISNDLLRDRIFEDRRGFDLMKIRENDAAVDLHQQIEWQQKVIENREDQLRRNEARVRELGGAIR
jgi:hypothetical protein